METSSVLDSALEKKGDSERLNYQTHVWQTRTKGLKKLIVGSHQAAESSKQTGHKQVIKGDKRDDKIKKIKNTVIKIYRSAKAEQNK